MALNNFTITHAFTILAFNDISALILEVCGKISNQIQAKISFIPTSTVDSLNIVKNSNGLLSWFQGPSLIEKLNEISMRIQIPLYKLFRRPSFAVLDTKELDKKRNDIKTQPNDVYHLVLGYVIGMKIDLKKRPFVLGYDTYYKSNVIIDGFFDMSDKLYLQPNVYRGKASSYQMSPHLEFNILSIKSFETKQISAMAG